MQLKNSVTSKFISLYHIGHGFGQQGMHPPVKSQYGIEHGRQRRIEKTH